MTFCLRAAVVPSVVLQPDALHAVRSLLVRESACKQMQHAVCRCVVPAVTLYTDNTCPSQLQNQENVVYIVQAANKGIITLDFKQNGDYYISSSVSVSKQMQLSLCHATVM
jgi:hypothetical protein